MRTQLYLRILSTNWGLVVSVLLIAIFFAIVIASNMQWVPHDTLVAVNWDERGFGPP